MIFLDWFGNAAASDVLAYASSPTSNVFDFPSLSLSGLQRIVLYLDDITVSAANVDLLVQLYIDGSLQTSGYAYSYETEFVGVADSDGADTSASGIIVGRLVDTGSNLGHAAEVNICNVDVALNKLVFASPVHIIDAGGTASGETGGMLPQTGNVTGVKVLGSGGNITAGKAAVLAMRTS